jgi:hypothetical protein
VISDTLNRLVTSEVISHGEYDLFRYVSADCQFCGTQYRVAEKPRL